HINRYSIQNARNFNKEVKQKTRNLLTAPFIGRPAHYDKNIRELIYKGYCIPYAVRDDTITVLGIYGANLWSEKS
ncbi:type II toxin-antitoxin system RelE/ParE family toxin, partial [Helicobacter sp. 11S02629-2]|uniref:type II toxin-antitoxin system RelE/ParE family toxin n=1 Tax=Helicobacter sp. 11S02629-2 TaxID=1476195 RepID=UPI000BA79F90